MNNPTHSSAGTPDHGDKTHGHHITPVKTLLMTLSALLLLTVLTVWASRVDFSHYNRYLSWLQVDLHFLNIVIAMGIACLKTALVISFFMGLKYDKPFSIIVFLSGFIFLGVFFVYTLTDTLTRGLVYKHDSFKTPFDSPVKIDSGSVHGHGAEPSVGEHPAP